MRVDEHGFIHYVDPVIELGEENAGEPELPEGITEANVFSLHSKPGASSVLYVDFDGHDLIDTRWNVYSGQTTLNMRPYDLDGNYTSFSTAEVTRIGGVSIGRVIGGFVAPDHEAEHNRGEQPVRSSYILHRVPKLPPRTKCRGLISRTGSRIPR